MVGMGTGRVDLDPIGQALLFDEFAEYTLRGRRAADISEADKKDFDHCA